MSYRQIWWDEVEEGLALPVLTMDLDYRHAIMHVGAGRDYMRGHHDPDYARLQGQKTIYFNTLFHQSMVDRVVTDWAGPRTFIVRRKIAMRGPICAGDALRGEGSVTRLWADEAGRHRADLRITLSTGSGPCCEAECSIVLPRRP